ncbi:hypothetical protein [Chondromyces apiculatus]|uniref:Uncharacterized protein n=1 Tax=Chondromyces apiculatus DSM 436 TaxID=1192034 RepID=A0A017TC77_9BACT|nr:hypothetical protein [Chondromyces apiculatus]EYF06410.1 Hypothetical protein CAP_1940 [Chondromyces apiculatus DSM 436]
MGQRDPYLFVVHFEEGVFGRAWLNDLPVHKVYTRGPRSMTGGANHLLVPGENRLTLEILTLPEGVPPPPPPPPPSETSAPPPKRVEVMPAGMKVYQVRDASTDPITIDAVVNVDLPVALGLKTWERPPLPLYHEVTFELPFPVTEPVYWRAPPAEFPCTGTPALVEVVREVHDALVQRDLARFQALLALKHASYAAAFPGEPSASLDRQRAASEKFFGLRYLVKPLDLTRVHFQPRAGGRVAYVSGWDDAPVLEAVCETEPGLSLRANLLLTQHDGRWRVFG